MIRGLGKPIVRRTVLSGLGAAAMAPFLTSSRVFAQGGTPLNFGIQNNFPGALSIIWGRQRIFERVGLNVKPNYLSDGRTVRDALIAGQLDAGSMNLTPYLVGAATGQFVALAKVFVGDSVGLVVRRDSDIKDVSDLRGKKISITVGSTTGTIFMEKVGPAFGLKKEDYTVVNLPPADQISAIVAGSVDAVTGPEPYLTMAEVEQIGRVLLRFGKWDPSPNMLVASRSFVDQRPEDAVKLAQSWLMTIDLWNNEPDKAAGDLLSIFQEAGYKKLTIDAVRSMMATFQIEPTITPEFVTYMQEQAKSMINAGRLPREPDWKTSVAPEIMERARKS